MTTPELHCFKRWQNAASKFTFTALLSGCSHLDDISLYLIGRTGEMRHWGGKVLHGLAPL
ncbi:hypothetical protein ES288_D07G145900v1 [Gossypium darwinii]|uniref:Uncharacterized protein n=1 Tax=Gossypium darwinii TaxID=34276 RepID=A0A5D2BWH3_GOSDA|nr:hypothetical protein ES288_D07G145900v1 [Gossypium darwinii]